jgi:hypothetical protein
MKTIICEFSKYCPSHHHLFAAVVSAVMVFSVIIVGFQTVRVVIPPPLLADMQVAYATDRGQGEDWTVEYARNITITRDFVGTVTRTIYCDNASSFDVPSTIREFTVGNYDARRAFIMPRIAGPGSKCRMETLITWRPDFSLRDHSFKIKATEFTLGIPMPDEVRNKYTKGKMP